MSREQLLGIISDRLGGTVPLPAAIDGLAAPHTPRLTFHDALDDEITPWLVRFDAKPVSVKQHTVPRLPTFTVTRYEGHLHGTTIEIELFREVS